MKDNIAVKGGLCGETPAGIVQHRSKNAAMDYAPARAGNNGKRLPAGLLVRSDARKKIRIAEVRPEMVKNF